MQLLGAVLAILSGATFALTNATGRRGVITGTPVQGMVISMPVGLACFVAVVLTFVAIWVGSRLVTRRRHRSNVLGSDVTRRWLHDQSYRREGDEP